MPNHAPQLLNLALNVTIAEHDANLAPVLLDSDVSFSDLENNFSGGRLMLSVGEPLDQVGIRNQGTGQGQIGVSGSNVTWGGMIIGAISGGEMGQGLTVTFNSFATAAAIEALIENLTYRTFDDDPNHTRSNLVLSIVDGAHAPGHVELDLAAAPLHDSVERHLQPPGFVTTSVAATRHRQVEEPPHLTLLQLHIAPEV